MSTTTHTDVLILGGGLVGATLALALARHGLGCVVVDPADLAVTLAPAFDGRASAIASASGRMLDAIGVGERLAGLGQPIAAIRVSEASGSTLAVPKANVESTGDTRAELQMNAFSVEAEYRTATLKRETSAEPQP